MSRIPSVDERLIMFMNLFLDSSRSEAVSAVPFSWFCLLFSVNSSEYVLKIIKRFEIRIIGYLLRVDFNG